MKSIVHRLFMGSLALMVTFGSALAEPTTPPTDEEMDAGVLADFEIPEMVQVRVKHGESLYDLAHVPGQCRGLGEYQRDRLAYAPPRRSAVGYPDDEGGADRLSERAESFRR